MALLLVLPSGDVLVIVTLLSVFRMSLPFALVATPSYAVLPTPPAEVLGPVFLLKCAAAAWLLYAT